MREQTALLRFVLGGLAHDLGTPLNVMQGVSQLLLAGAPPPKVGERLDNILRQVGAMTKMLRSAVDGADLLPGAPGPESAAPVEQQLQLAKELRPELRWEPLGDTPLAGLRCAAPDLTLVVWRWVELLEATPERIYLWAGELERPLERRCLPGTFLRLSAQPLPTEAPPPSGLGEGASAAGPRVWRPPRHPGVEGFDLRAARLAAVASQARGYITHAPKEPLLVWLPVTAAA